MSGTEITCAYLTWPLQKSPSAVLLVRKIPLHAQGDMYKLLNYPAKSNISSDIGVC